MLNNCQSCLKIHAVGLQRPCLSKKNTGLALIEALVAILIFSIGLLSALKLQSDSVLRSRDALYRAEAAALAHEIIGIMWTDLANLPAYAHNPVATTECSPTANATSNPNATRWLDEFTSVGNGRYLPGATSSKQQIIIDSAPPTVTVRICWRAPQDSSDSNFVAISKIAL